MAKCCFAGHNMVYNETQKNVLIKECEKLILKYNVNEFLVGNYGSFDKLVSNVIRMLKEKYPKVKLNLILPYLTKEISENKKYYYKSYDELIIPDISENVPIRYRIIKANEYMVDNSDFLICYISHYFGGAAKTYSFAVRKQSIKIINIFKYF